MIIICYIADKWVVNILNRGIGSKLCVVAICNSASTLNIYGFYTGKILLTWQRDQIIRSGCIESLVFLEIDETYHGEPELLWMKCPIPQSVTLQEHIHK